MGPLKQLNDAGKTVYALEGRPVEQGEVFELELADGTWLTLRLELTTDGIFGILDLAGGHQVVLRLPAEAMYRRPKF